MYVYEKLLLSKQTCQLVHVCLQKDTDCFFCLSRHALLYMYMYVNEKIRNVSFVLADMLGCTFACICLQTGKKFLLCWQTCQVVHVHVCIYGQVRSFFYVGRHARLVSLLQKLRGTLNPETSLSLCKGASHPVLHQTECVHNQMDKVREQVPATHTCMCKWSHTFMQLVAKASKTRMQVCFSVFLVYQTLWARFKKKIQHSSSFNFAYFFSNAISRTLFHSIVICELFIETTDIFKYIHERLKFYVLVNYRTQQKRLIGFSTQRNISCF